MDQADIPALLSRLASDEDAARKMAVFKLQSSINDPAFADVFISSGGLVILRRLILSTGGNTLAYALQSLSRLLEVDMGWDIFEGPTSGDLVERIVELIVTNPLVNILRGAMSILVALVGHRQASSAAAAAAAAAATAGQGGHDDDDAMTPPPPRVSPPASFGFRALKPAVAVYPQFFELVIQQLQSADHALCANALMLVNALIRDAVSSDPPSVAAAPTTASAAGSSSTEDWSKMIKRLQDLGLIKAVYNLMQSSALQDLAHPLLEFQSLTKVILRKWREVRVDPERPEHRRALKGLHLASAPPTRQQPDGSSANGGGGGGAASDAGTTTSGTSATAATATATATATAAAAAAAAAASGIGKKASRRHNPEKWRRLGFETESPAAEFDQAGFLGMMDLTDYVRKNEDGFQKLLLEQSARPLRERCPVARASLAVSLTLYEHFEVDRSSDVDDLFSRDLQGYYQSLDGGDVDHGKEADRIFRPLLLQWSRLHTAGLQAFFRLWKATGAERDDFEKVAELMRILVEQVVGQAGRTKDVADVEEELQEFECARLRELQMGLLELSFEDQWGQHLCQVREELRLEALQFAKEQRIRCLLQGSWFARPVSRRDREASATAKSEQPDEQTTPTTTTTTTTKKLPYTAKGWRFAKLSHNRRYLHYGDFAQPAPPGQDPGLDALPEKIDLSTISSVVSNVSATASDLGSINGGGGGGSEAKRGIRALAAAKRRSAAMTTTKITVYALDSSSSSSSRDAGAADETTAAAANGGPREVAILTLHPANHSLASEWLDGLLMLLNQAPITAETNKLVTLVSDYGIKIRLLNVRLEAVYAGPQPGAGAVPSREGLDDDYYYEI